MDKEEILVNLRILETVQKNQKLISRGPYLNIEPVSIIPEFARRWHRQDNRNECLNKINLIVNCAIDFINKTSNNNNSVEVDKDNMKSFLEKALKGISNLKETYATCSQTCARIDVVLKKIQDCLNIKEE